MVQGRENPVCMWCGKKPAVWPKDARLKMFCTVKCAALFGAYEGSSKTYCRKHKEWHYFDEGCFSCDGERLEREKK